MPTVDEYKLAILWQLAELEAEERYPVLPLRAAPIDEAIRAVAELTIEGIAVFDDDLLTVRLTSRGLRIMNEVIQELERKRN